MGNKAPHVIALDEYVCSRYCNYQKITAIPGYKMPDLIVIEKDGNIGRKDSSLMKLCHQPECETLLERLKERISDTDYTFAFFRPRFSERMKNLFRKPAFAKLLPEILAHYHETPQSVGEKLTIDKKFWNLIVKGKLYPEKNTLLALAFACGMSVEDVKTMFETCEFWLSDESVRDVVVEYLLVQKIFNLSMMSDCFREYHIESIPLKGLYE